ncbi:MAG: hypothetical protein Q8L27_00750 [archaeon]|nr:hypothetical protein [archaeon]
MNLLKNKSADERYLFIWMILNWVVIGIAIMIGVSIFYSAQADSRTAETFLLSEKISDCISNDFSLIEVSSDNFDISSKCGLNKEAIVNSDLYYLNIEIKLGDKIQKVISLGNGQYKVLCGGISDSRKNLPVCLTKTLEASDSDTGIKYNLNILVASNQI